MLYNQDLLNELNGSKNPQELTELCRKSKTYAEKKKKNGQKGSKRV